MAEETTEVAERPETSIAPLPPMRSIIAPPGNFQSYMEKLWQTAHDAIKEADALVEERTRERDKIEALMTTLEEQTELALDDDGQQYAIARGQLQGARSQLTRALKRQKHAIAFRDALGSGYVPLPRMPAVKLRWVQELMPRDVLDAMEEARKAGMFEEFRVVTGQDATRGGWPRTNRALGPDPILVGMIGDEMFAIGWWR